MERVYTPNQRPFSEVRHVAIALKSANPDQRHIGILHRSRETDQVLLLDLAWHMTLRNDAPGNGYIWIDPSVSTREATQIAMICRRLWRANQTGKIPYGFSAPSDCFDEATSAFLTGSTKFGLTCATFVLAVFDHAGLILLDWSAWPHRDDDTIWQKQIIRALREGGAPAEHLQLLESDVGCIRIRPEEVGGAAILSPWPVGFTDAVRVAEHIVTFLNKLTAQ